MLIRQANNSDASSLSALAKQTYSDAFGHSLAPSDLAAHLENNLSLSNFERMLNDDHFLVAVLDARLFGYVQFGPVTLPKPVSANDREVRRLYVLSEFQNQGIGARLLEIALEHSDMQSAENIYINVWNKSLGAQRFYARFGFKVIGEREFTVQSGAETDPDLVMVLRRPAN